MGKRFLLFLCLGVFKMKPSKALLAVSLIGYALFIYATPDVFAQGYFIRGDANCDGFVDSTDIAYLTAYVFTGGPPPPCMDAGDVNDNGSITSADIAYLTSFLYSGGSPPPPPYPLCGTDPTADGLGCLSDCCPNHFKAYAISPKTFGFSAFTKDQFMEDGLFLTGPMLLANPVQKDTFPIVDTTHHLHWYFAEGRDTLITVNFENQFETTTVEIDSVRFFLVPVQKFPHAPPESLDHYKCYRIRQAEWLQKSPFMLDQFTPTAEVVDSVMRDLFCAPCQKNTEPTFDTFTHYVAYLLAPGQPFVPPLIRQTADQFRATWVDTVLGSKYILVPTIKSLPTPPPDTGKNHYKTWRVNPIPFTGTARVRDQFMDDFLGFDRLEFLSNPVRKIVGPDTSKIIDPDDHLTWYRASGRDTLLRVEYVNQFESTTVIIDSVHYFLVPTTKLPHPPYDSLDHYKAYRIRNPLLFNRPVQLQDQFDPTPELITSLLPKYFLTPAQKNSEPVFDTVTHYVAYSIDPKTTTSEVRDLINQFGSNDVTVLNSEMLLVPTRKIASSTPPPDTGHNHYKTWRVVPEPFTGVVEVEDQFVQKDTLFLELLEFLSNPTEKDSFFIVDSDQHLNWYRVFSNRLRKQQVIYENQFESTLVDLDTVKYLLVPAQKLPHNPPESLDHYKCYRIKNPQTLIRQIGLRDQFDAWLGKVELLDSVTQAYFCTPCIKNNENRYDSLTHYVVYEFTPQTEPLPGYTTIDQFGTHPLQPVQSEKLLVPTQKLCEAIPGDANADNNLTLADIIATVNYVFNKPGWPPCPTNNVLCWLSGLLCRGDWNASGNVTLADVIQGVNYVFNKPGGPWNPKCVGVCCLPPCI